MRILFRVTLVLFSLGVAASASPAFWRHKATGSAAGVPCPPAVAAPACAPATTYVPETRDVYTTRYRAEVRYVPETVVTRVTTMVPVQQPVFAPAAGCHGFAPGAGCHGVAPGVGCHGVAPGAGCHGSAPGAGSNWFHVGSAESASPSRYAQLDARIGGLEDAIARLTESLTAGDRGGAKDGTAPAPAVPPLPARPATAAVTAADSDPLLDAARAFKARQAAARGGPAAEPDGRVSSK